MGVSPGCPGFWPVAFLCPLPAERGSSTVAPRPQPHLRHNCRRNVAVGGPACGTQPQIPCMFKIERRKDGLRPPPRPAGRTEYWWWIHITIVVLAITQVPTPAPISGRPHNRPCCWGYLARGYSRKSTCSTCNRQKHLFSLVAAFFLIFAGLWLIVTVIPGFTVEARRSPPQSGAVRRLQDSNLSSWWVLLLLAAGRSRPESARFDASLS